MWSWSRRLSHETLRHLVSAKMSAFRSQSREADVSVLSIYVFCHKLFFVTMCLGYAWCPWSRLHVIVPYQFINGRQNKCTNTAIISTSQSRLLTYKCLISVSSRNLNVLSRLVRPVSWCQELRVSVSSWSWALTSRAHPYLLSYTKQLLQRFLWVTLSSSHTMLVILHCFSQDRKKTSLMCSTLKQWNTFVAWH